MSAPSQIPFLVNNEEPTELIKMFWYHTPIEEINQYLKENKNQVNVQTKNSFLTPLLYIIDISRYDSYSKLFNRHYQLSVIKLLLEYGADINIYNVFFGTSYILCCYLDDVETFQLLLEYGLDPELLVQKVRMTNCPHISYNYYPLCPLPTSTPRGSFIHEMNIPLIEYAIEINACGIVKLLLDRGIKVNSYGSKHNSILLRDVSFYGYIYTTFVSYKMMILLIKYYLIRLINLIKQEKAYFVL